MKFIHLADAHLGSPFLGLSFLPSAGFKQIQQAPDKSFIKIIDLALEKKVDLVLIAGDTFDSNLPTPSSQLFFARQIKRLTQAEIQVVMIFGNHDYMTKDDLSVAPSPYFKLLGDREKVETAAFTTKNGFNYQVTGFSYCNNHITEDKLSSFPTKNNTYTFGLMHAQEKAGAKNQNVYAPFSLSELKDLNYDYFALGHIHLRQVLSQNPLIVYSGNIQGRHIKELNEKGCYLGEIDEITKATKLTFIKTAPIIWKKIEVKLSAPLAKSALQESILAAIGKLEDTSYLSLKITGAEFLTADERELVMNSDFWQAISEQLPFSSYLVDVRFAANSQMEVAANDRQFFQEAAEEIFTRENFAGISKKWAGKDQLAAKLAADPQFLAEVRSLAQVKLTSRLKGISNETEKD